MALTGGNAPAPGLGRQVPAAPGWVAGLGAGGNGGWAVPRKRLEPVPGWLGGKGLGGRSGGVLSRLGSGTAGSVVEASTGSLAVAPSAAPGA